VSLGVAGSIAYVGWPIIEPLLCLGRDYGMTVMAIEDVVF